MDWLATASSIVTLFGAIVSVYQAIQAKSAAKAAIEARDEIRERRGLSILSDILSQARQCQNMMTKYGPTSTAENLSGVSFSSDGTRLQEFVLFAREHQHYWPSKEANLTPIAQFCEALNVLLKSFGNAKDPAEYKEKGNEILQLLSGFVSQLREMVDLNSERLPGLN